MKTRPTWRSQKILGGGNPEALHVRVRLGNFDFGVFRFFSNDYLQIKTLPSSIYLDQHLHLESFLTVRF